MKLSIPYLLALSTILLVLGGCSQVYTVSINDQSVYDPSGRLLSSEVEDSDLQGCINLAVRQQNLNNPQELSVLSCPNSQIASLERIGEFGLLLFLDLGNNIISNLTPLESLEQLSGLNLTNNAIADIAPLFNMQSLSSVILTGNDQISCNQLALLRQRLGDKLVAPAQCRN
jgi:Leucine-rich repeat (LRR) protein